jgi:hypothetical protein
MIDEDIENHILIKAAIDSAVRVLPGKHDGTIGPLVGQKPLNGVEDAG